MKKFPLLAIPQYLYSFYTFSLLICNVFLEVCHKKDEEDMFVMNLVGS